MLSAYAPTLLNASWITLQLAFISLATGLVLSLIIVRCEMSRHRLLAWPTTLFVALIRGLPELLVILFIFFGSGQALFYLTGQYVNISPFISGVIALSLIFAAYASQTLRGAFNAVPKDQSEAARALAIGKNRTFFRIILPQALRHAMPGLTNQWLVLLKDTALVSLIGVSDLMKQAQLNAAATHNSFIWYASAALIYLAISLLTQQINKRLNKAFQVKGASYNPVKPDTTIQPGAAP